MERTAQLCAMARENRRNIITMIYRGKAGHPGGSLSVADLLTALCAEEIDWDREPRARLVLSKGHAVPALYAALHAAGRVSGDELSTYRQLGSRLQGHPNNGKVPEIDATTGLLGQGLSVGMGMALGKKRLRDPHPVYVISGDGELDEGQNWEAALQAAHFALDNLVWIIDRNGLSSSGPTEEVLRLGDLAKKIEDFGFRVREIDGHDMADILAALAWAKQAAGKPSCIIARTVKGKGVSFMEHQVAWHGGALTDEQYATAMRELEGEGQ